MDKFNTLASPNCLNFVFGLKFFLCSAMGIIDSIMALKDHSTFKFVPDIYPTFRFEKTMRHNSTTSAPDYKNKWESVGLMDGYYVVGVTSNSYLSFRVIIVSINHPTLQLRPSPGEGS